LACNQQIITRFVHTCCTVESGLEQATHTRASVIMQWKLALTRGYKSWAVGKVTTGLVKLYRLLCYIDSTGSKAYDGKMHTLPPVLYDLIVVHVCGQLHLKLHFRGWDNSLNTSFVIYRMSACTETFEIRLKLTQLLLQLIEIDGCRLTHVAGFGKWKQRSLCSRVDFEATHVLRHQVLQ